MNTERFGNWIGTYTNKKFFTLDPRKEEYDILDVAHALSNLCRYTGHSTHFYSVGQHSILVSTQMRAAGLSAKMQLYGLLHDLSEAYLADINRPTKVMLPEYIAIEKVVQDMGYEAFGVPVPTEEEHHVLKWYDDLLLWNEIEQLTNRDDFEFPEEEFHRMNIPVGIPNIIIRELFLIQYEQLMEEYKMEVEEFGA